MLLRVCVVLVELTLNLPVYLPVLYVPALSLPPSVSVSHWPALCVSLFLS
jgi:hypothetical protein